MHKRLLTLFKLLNESDDKITCKALSNHLKVSERTIRTDITSINETLEKNGAIIKIKKGEGYYIDILNLGLYQQYLAVISDDIMDSSEIPDSPMERNQYILKYILYNNTYIKLEDLANSLYVSKVTILNDIKRIKPILSKYDLILVSKPYYGVKVEGKEIDIRRCISNNIINRDFENYIIGITDREIELFNNVDLIELQKIVLREINKFNINFLDFNLKNFIIHLAITISRILDGYCLDNILDIVLTDFELNIAVENIFDYIETKYNITILKADRIYLYNHFISKSYPVDTVSKGVDTKIIEYVEELLDVINNQYTFDLRDDNVLFNDLVLHFKSILNSKSYNLNKVNPLINTIKSNYPLAFEITLNAIEKVFKKSIYSLTEDEVGYVSLHIGAGIERFFQNNIKCKNVVLVCGSGYGSSRLLEVQLNKVFHEKINILKCLSFNQFLASELSNVDIIISTIPLSHSSIPVVLVDLKLLKKDIENISKSITNDSHTYSNLLENFFDKNLFIVAPKVKDKDELINLMCNQLTKNEIVFPSFTESVFYRESLSSTNIDDFLAIPHPMELSSIKTKICISMLEEPIYWNKDSTVKLVIMLAINKDDYIKMNSIYDIFLKIINDSDIRNNISNCNDFENFISIIKSII
ncbi:BglG family transcription antiterminator, partial [Clostridioides difficile]|nr:BglG family transcription antiterminator [Clostridioides difficile]